MRIEYINPFVEAAFDILNEVLDTSVKRGQLYLKKLGESMKGIAVVIGVTGQVTGRIVFDMTEDTAVKITSKLNNEEFKEFHDMAKSTIAELANMITGRAVTKLEKEGLAFNFTPPTIITGTNLNIYEGNSEMEALIIPIDTGLGIVEINIAFKE
ncbi:MAG: chemotaxis protein CheX [Brevinematales bacterium]|jgi:chemotaxis protein CheX|nr:chemotaxis protein CheX [Brevinematales bacterium]